MNCATLSYPGKKRGKKLGIDPLVPSSSGFRTPERLTGLLLFDQYRDVVVADEGGWLLADLAGDL
jgi:hypothetical protein